VKDLIDKLILEAINKALSVLGEKSKKAILRHWASIFHTSYRNILDNIFSFQEALKLFLGKGYYGFVSIFVCYLQSMTKQRIDGTLSLSEIVVSLRLNTDRHC